MGNHTKFTVPTTNTDFTNNHCEQLLLVFTVITFILLLLYSTPQNSFLSIQDDTLQIIALRDWSKSIGGSVGGQKPRGDGLLVFEPLRWIV